LAQYLSEFYRVLNLLSKDGGVYYIPNFLSELDANRFRLILQDDIEWRHDENYMFGKRIITRRQVAWYGDKDYKYTYSQSEKTALNWTPTLVEIKEIIERSIEEKFNSCLLNLYHDGTEGMGWHSDDEPELKKHGVIVSLSLGAERKFEFKHKKTLEKVSIPLQHGSLLIMKGEIQSHWQHRLTVSTKVKESRINLTFRTMND
jgi:alkylated DNA repair dioxygenase AlkB